jgi:hypothetical protein
MRKIKHNFHTKDRVICVALQGEIKFYYQAFGTRERIDLFKDFIPYSGSLFNYFRQRGRCLSDRGFSLTLNELYERKKYENVKLAKLFDRLPSAIDRALSECSKHNEQVKYTSIVKNADKVIYDLEIAA